MLPAQGKSSKDFAADLGYIGSVEIVHRDNIALLSLTERSRQQVTAQQVCLPHWGDRLPASPGATPGCMQAHGASDAAPQAACLHPADLLPAGSQPAAGCSLAAGQQSLLGPALQPQSEAPDPEPPAAEGLQFGSQQSDAPVLQPAGLHPPVTAAAAEQAQLGLHSHGSSPKQPSLHTARPPLSAVAEPGAFGTSRQPLDRQEHQQQQQQQPSTVGSPAAPNVGAVAARLAILRQGGPGIHPVQLYRRQGAQSWGCRERGSGDGDVDQELSGGFLQQWQAAVAEGSLADAQAARTTGSQSQDITEAGWLP